MFCSTPKTLRWRRKKMFPPLSIQAIPLCLHLTLRGKRPRKREREKGKDCFPSRAWKLNSWEMCPLFSSWANRGTVVERGGGGDGVCPGKWPLGHPPPSSSSSFSHAGRGREGGTLSNEKQFDTAAPSLVRPAVEKLKRDSPPSLKRYVLFVE